MPDETPRDAPGAPFFGFRQYDFWDWYWKADDGRIWSSKTRALMQESDQAYVDWLVGHLPSEWPRDATGSQTDAALQAVFDSYNIVVGGTPMAQLPETHPQRLLVRTSKPSSK